MGRNGKNGASGTTDERLRREDPPKGRPRRNEPASGKAHDDPRAMKLAETTDVSPNQAKELLRKHGEAEAKRRAKDFKAEG